MLQTSAQQPESVPARLTIPDGTPIRLRLAENVSSAHAHKGDRLNFVVVRDVNLDGLTVIPAGTTAEGSVTSVRHKHLMGIGGRLSLKVDSLTLADGDEVSLRASKSAKGGSRTKLMMGGMMAAGLIFWPATPVFLLIHGRDTTVVKSTEINAQIIGGSSVLSAELQPSRESSSDLAETMAYLPPRVFNAEGQQGDMLNLVFVAQQKDLEAAFQRAGWVKTDAWKPSFVWHLLRYRTNDASIPMARFNLFGRVQDYSLALPDPAAIVSRRHHIRIWKTQCAIDGTPIWVGAASHDVAIEIAKRGRLINHRIDPAVDAERDFVGSDLTGTSLVARQEYLHSADPVLHAETVSGEAYHSDGRILLLDLQPTTAASNGLSGSPHGFLGAALGSDRSFAGMSASGAFETVPSSR